MFEDAEPSLVEKATNLVNAGLLDLSASRVRAFLMGGEKFLAVGDETELETGEDDVRAALEPKRREIEATWEKFIMQKIGEARQDVEKAHPSRWLEGTQVMRGDFARYMRVAATLQADQKRFYEMLK